MKQIRSRDWNPMKHAKRSFQRIAASVKEGSEPTFAARYMNDCIGGELSNAFERPLRAAPPVPAFGLHPS